MDANIPPDQDDIAWLNDYAAEVHEAFGAEFRDAGNRFARGKALLQQFTKAVGSVRTRGWGYFNAVDERHNELCIASAILANPSVVQLDYEPRLPGCAKSIDFQATAEDGMVSYVDVKTIKPDAKDGWKQYERAQQEKWLPKRVQVVLSKGCIGGEIWHSMFAARSSMLDYTLKLEAKIAKLSTENARFVMAFCGEGFNWDRSELEDFVSFYFKGRHRDDDPFSQAELKDMKDKGRCFDRTITRFACMSRPQGTVRQRPIHWNVQPPCDPFA